MRRIVVAVLLSALALAATASPAFAHERRAVGPYTFEVGWLGEPAFAGAMNAVDLTVTDTRSNDKPVEGLEKTLQVEVFYGGLTTPLSVALRTRFGLPGTYAADLMPTKDGSYAFRIFGKVESLDVNQRFESGPGRFNDVQKVNPLQYPEQVPSGGDLAASLADLKSRVDQIRLLAIAALVLGVAAVGVSLWRRRA